MQKRLYQYDLLRGFAAIFVCLYHYLYIYPLQSGTYDVVDIAYLGKYGVDIFFILSGFVISFTISKLSYNKFIISRFSRIYPQYVICMILTLTICYLYGEREIGITDIIANLFLLSHSLGFSNVDGVYWSLSYEVSFYFIISIVYYYFYKYKRINVKINYLVTLMILCQLSILMLNKFVLNGSLDALTKILGLRFLHLFMIGYLILKYFTDGVINKNWITSLFICLAAQLLINSSSLLPVIVSCIIMVTLLKIKINSSKLIILSKYLGALSYPFYLLHQYIGYQIIDDLYSSLGVYSLGVAFVSVTMLSSIALFINDIFMIKIQGMFIKVGEA